jgi:hydroxyacylglutathione hydrolase
MLDIKTFTGSGFGENAYLVRKRGSDTAVAIDPGADAATMVRELETHRLELTAIILTHAHLDHIEGIAVLKRHADAPLYLHPGDRLFYDNAAMQAAQFGMKVEKLPPVDHWLQSAQRLSLADIDFEVKHVPGHCQGHVLFYVADAAVAFVGDVVFQGSIGRTDLPGGDYQQLMRSIRDHVMTLPNETTLYSGHGPATTVEEERAFNPFIAPLYGGSLA